ncbi:hypothetical protein EJ08DRAFT_419515 [Tothia fuscella]|uniref:dual-specificity kinase n=1 Tax=Tothia fuscella TaxID=1048955 RepID=A0A9P4NJQ3_9PEZI|nr:hypothetical protein EJ08DRAFT_419515 [Tothia fuscella]
MIQTARYLAMESSLLAHRSDFEDSQASGAEGRARKRFQRTTSENEDPLRKNGFSLPFGRQNNNNNNTSSTTATPTEQKMPQHARRRSTLRDNNKAPLLGPRPLENKRVTSESHVASHRPSYLPQSTSEHSLSQSVASGNNPRYNFAPQRQQEESRDRQEGHTEPDFLPSVNFDDFHERITSYRPDLNSFPTPGTRGRLRLESPSTSTSTRARLDSPSTRATLDSPSRLRADGKLGNMRTAMDGDTGRGLPEQPKIPRSASLVRRFSNARRTTSRSTDTTSMLPPAAPVSGRARRQSTLPSAPATGTNTATRAPRKSVGPGLITQGFEERRAAREAQPSSGSVSRTSSVNKGPRQSLAPGSVNLAEPSRTFANRNLKTKSLQPPPRNTSQSFLTPGPGTPINSTAPQGNALSPGRPAGNRTHTPSSSGNKRQSTMQQHVSGLGARTISPTDARRLKRMSTAPPRPPVPQAPLTPQPDSLQNLRANLHSPAIFQTPKSLTPSSARGTPDIAPKTSGALGLSISQASSLASLRQSNGGSTSRNSQILNSSRLPTAKPRNVHSSAGVADDEEVPPVPAIPKAFESPKDQVPHEQNGSYFPARRTRTDSEEPPLPGRASRTQAGSRSQTGSKLASRPSIDSPRTSLSQDGRNISLSANNPRHRRPMTSNVGESDRSMAGAGPNVNKKTLQPLRLPPLNLLPLSTPTAARIASFAAPSQETNDRHATPPPKRTNTKTPSTPMTASKATFFSRSQRETEDEYQVFNLRSASSHHAIHNGFGDRGVGISPTTPIAIPSPITRQGAPTPFSSNSLPKNSSDFGGHLFAKPMDEYTYDHHVNAQMANEKAPSPKPVPVSKRDAASTRTSTSDEPSTPASTTSLRRKLSLSWKRSSSKASQRAKAEAERQERAERPEMTDKQREEVKRASRQQTEMPPPKLPASATWNVSPNQGEPQQSRPSLDQRLRKPSSNNTNVVASNNNTSLDAEMSIFMGSSESKPEGYAPPTYADHRHVASRSTSSSLLNPMQRMLGAKSSLGTLKARHLDTNLDKDDLAADKIMEKMGSRRKDFELAARELDDLHRRAHPKERASPVQAVQMVNLNIFERGEIIDYKEVYFCGTRAAKKHVGDLDQSTNNFGYDDDRGDYNIVMGDHLAYRYEVVDMLGKGSFGQVVRCIDHKTGQLVAIKIIRNKKRFHQQALVEVNILQKLREWDPENKHSMINFTQSFYFRGHLCISTELLGMNLYEFIKAYEFKGFPLPLIRRFTKQMLSSLTLLKSKRVIHCDLKPENILLAHPMHSEIKVIDFGSSCFENEKVYTYIQSRFYRSPEVILGMSYGIPIDMWSVGCILAELLTGYPIFPGENEQEQLACIMEIFGPPEKHLIEKSSRKKLFFDSMGKPRVTVSSKGRRRRASSKTLQQALKCDDEYFLDFITRCLRWDPERRLKPEEAMRHEFVTGQKRGAPVSNRTRIMQGTGPTSAAQSPIKRFNTVQTPQRKTTEGSRPLPEPPQTSFRHGSAVPPPSASPVKPMHPGAGRRHSTFTAGQTGGKRNVSAAPGGNNAVSGGSNLPRVALPPGRSVSGKPDLASAAAVASLRPR